MEETTRRRQFFEARVEATSVASSRVWYNQIMTDNYSETSHAERAADALSIQQVRAFCVVVDASSYAEASKLLGTPVPTLWEQVRAVQRCYGVELLARSGRGVQPTPFARTLRGALEPLIVGIDSTLELRDRLQAKAEAKLTLVAGVRMVLEDLGAPLEAFRQKEPGTALRLLHGDAATATQLVHDGDADLALTVEPDQGLLGDAIDVTPAYDVTYLAVAQAGHSLSNRKTVRLAELVGEPLVVGRGASPSRRLLEEALRREGIDAALNVAAETDNSAYTAQCVRAGLGVGVMAGRLSGALTEGLVARDLTPHMGRARIVFLAKAGRILPGSAETLMATVRATLGKKRRRKAGSGR